MEAATGPPALRMWTLSWDSLGASPARTTLRVVPGATSRPRLPGAWIWPRPPNNSRLTVAGVLEALVRASTEVRPTVVLAPASHWSFEGCPQVAAALPCRSPSVAVYFMAPAADAFWFATALALTTFTWSTVRSATTPARSSCGAAAVGAGPGSLAISTAAVPSRCASRLPGSTPPALSTAALTLVAAVADSGRNWASVPASVPSSNRAGPGHTPTLAPAGTAALATGTVRLDAGSATSDPAATTAPPPARIRTPAATPAIAAARLFPPGSRVAPRPGLFRPLPVPGTPAVALPAEPGFSADGSCPPACGCPAVSGVPASGIPASAASGIPAPSLALALPAGGVCSCMLVFLTQGALVP